MKPLVSIITPTYNHEKYIHACIQSTIDQTYTDWEMIIIDDGSTDSTTQIISEFADRRIKYIRQDHLGVYQLGATYNKALALAQGEIIAILEGDDFWPADKLGRQITSFDEPSVVLDYGSAIQVDTNGAMTRKLQSLSHNNQPIGSILPLLLNPFESKIYSPTVCIRKNALQKIGGFVQPDYLASVDYSTYCHLALEGEFRYLPETLGYWRRHIRNTSLSENVRFEQGRVKYSLYFLDAYSHQINSLPARIDVGSIKDKLLKLSSKLELGREYWLGRQLLEQKEPDKARQMFMAYLKRRAKSTSSSILSLAGIVSSYIQVNLITITGRLAKLFKYNPK
ncbi:MAG: glycosyltransferase [Planctomycetota bacterium]